VIHIPHHLDSDRAYRRICRAEQDETAYQVVVRETDLWIVGPPGLSERIVDLVYALRADVQAAIDCIPGFGPSLVPVNVPRASSPIVCSMARAAETAGVGPMAAVAGAIAQAVVENFGPEVADLLVENGGDVYLRSSKPRFIGLLSDPGRGVRLGIRIQPHEFPCAFCSSSSTIGHSLSLGHGDLVVVRSRDAALADAAATALGNMVDGPSSVSAVVSRAKRWRKDGLDGVLVQCGESLAVWGMMELNLL
jgi:hypothetical protein